MRQVQRVLVVLFAGLLVGLSGCAASRPWGPFEGRVVDAESGEAVAGAAVVVFWMRGIPNPVDSARVFYDARWAVSEGDGRFTVPRRSRPWNPLFLSDAYLTCVAPGYLPYDLWPLQDSRSPNEVPANPLTIRMERRPPLTREQLTSADWHARVSSRNLGSIPYPTFEKISEAVNSQRSTMHLPPIYLDEGTLEKKP
jgi:hypothetical protein